VLHEHDEREGEQHAGKCVLAEAVEEGSVET
jgi:hypothetical protein